MSAVKSFIFLTFVFCLQRIEACAENLDQAPISNNSSKTFMRFSEDKTDPLKLWYSRQARSIRKSFKLRNRYEKSAGNLSYSFNLNRTGEIFSIKITKSSGIKKFDDAVLAALKKRHPLFHLLVTLPIKRV